MLKHSIYIVRSLKMYMNVYFFLIKFKKQEGEYYEKDKNVYEIL